MNVKTLPVRLHDLSARACSHARTPSPRPTGVGYKVKWISNTSKRDGAGSSQGGARRFPNVGVLNSGGPERSSSRITGTLRLQVLPATRNRADACDCRRTLLEKP